MKNNIVLLAIWIITSVFPGPKMVDSQKSTSTVVQVSPNVTREGNDFATAEIGDAWDMNQYSDISKYLNSSGANVSLGNMAVDNGIFSATTLNTVSQLDPLFPGYQLANNVGKYGINYPIESSVYRCYHLMMKSDPGQGTSDYAFLFWFFDKSYAAGEFWGNTKYINITPSAWKLYNGDLTWPTNMGDAYDSQTFWQGIRFDPSRQTGSNFNVDWLRITDCNPVNVTFSWDSSSGSGEIWMAKTKTSPLIKLGDITNKSGSIDIDVQGWEAGHYFIGIPSESSWAELTIDPAPQITFIKPSADSGESLYWPMNSYNEISPGIPVCMSYALNNGILDMVTPGPGSQPYECAPNGAPSDPKVHMNLYGASIDTTQYRYLSYRFRQDGDYQNVNTGWVARWIWQTYIDNDPNRWCQNVSNDFAVDVGWETYLLDMHDPEVGKPEYAVGSGTCPSDPWVTRNINMLRFDPNENTTGSAFYQYLDYVRLSKPDEGQRDSTVTLGIAFSEPVNDLTYQLYYTTNLDNPKQNRLNLKDPIIPTRREYEYFLPSIPTNSIEGVNTIPFIWDTSGVSAGSYYICVEATDVVGNITLRCSQTIVNIN
jgi:hypothetical protein